MPEDRYASFYNRISAPFRSQGTIRTIRYADLFLTGIMYVLYPLLVLYLLFSHDERLIRTVLVPGISFVLVTVIRSLINRPRPYAAHQISPLIHKDKQGESMPSRHAFSAAVISMAFFRIMPWAGIVLLVLSALECLIRVIAGVHYPSDVIIGFLAGVIAGLLI